MSDIDEALKLIAVGKIKKQGDQNTSASQDNNSELSSGLEKVIGDGGNPVRSPSGRQFFQSIRKLHGDSSAQSLLDAVMVHNDKHSKSDLDADEKVNDFYSTIHDNPEVEKIKYSLNNKDNLSTSNKIPLPNYDDPKSRENYLHQWAKKYGNLEGRGDTVLKVNEIPRGGSSTAKNISIKAAKKFGLDPALLYSSSMEEGMSGLFKDKSGLDTRHRKPGEFGYQDFYGDKEFPINGGQSFGFQTFADRFPELVKKGLLPNEFSSKFRSKDAPMSQQGPNEVREKNSFKSVEDAMMATAALLKSNYDDVEEYAKNKGVQLSKKAKDFFALAEYNGGEGGFHKLLKKYHDSGLLKDDKFLKERPNKENIESYQDIWTHVSRRMKMAEALKEQGHFD